MKLPINKLVDNTGQIDGVPLIRVCYNRYKRLNKYNLPDA